MKLRCSTPYKRYVKSVTAVVIPRPTCDMLEFAMSFTANPDERLTTPGVKTPARLFMILLVTCVAAHAALVLAMILGDRSDLSTAFTPEEVTVEIVQEPPPQQPDPQPEPASPEPEQQQAAIPLDEKPAFDAPRAQSEEKAERETAVQPLKPQEAAGKPLPEVGRTVRDETTTPTAKLESSQSDQAASQDHPEEKLEAEALAPLELRRAETAPPPANAPPDSQPRKKSMAELLAGFEPLPTYEFGGAVRPSPISGGQSTTTYLSIIFGLVKAHLHLPTGPRPGNGPLKGDVTFEIDRGGRLIRASVSRPSGSGELDAAAMAAIRAASPFPPTPTGTPLGLVYSYSAK